MKKLLVGITLLVAGFSGLAKADDKGLEAAERVCSNLTYTDDRKECLAIVNKADSMQEEAVRICGNLTYAKDRIECLGAIKNLKYTATALQTCGNMTYAKDRISCLAEGGRSANRKSDNNGGEVDKAYVRSSLRKALNALKDRDSRKAEQIIENLIDTL